jgi:tetratricopeptide (TPR) repeat protein
MTPRLRRPLVFLLALFGCAIPVIAHEHTRPLTDREVLALVAGNALSENIVNEIDSRGVAFRPSDTYRSQLILAGASAPLLAALGKAKVSEPSATTENKSASELLQHLASAGKLMRAQRYQAAAEELNGALLAGAGPEAGFVMGEVLRRQQQWPMAASVYEEILQKDPGFPEARTKFSYLLYRLCDPEESLEQAEAALARTPDNAEAHKNAGLALQILGQFRAATAEYKEALRIKPDYDAVHYDLGILLYSKGDLDGSVTEYRKALALNPQDADAHTNLGLSLKEKGDLASAVREYREAKRLDPKNIEARQGLGEALAASDLNAEAVVEFRELEAMTRDSRHPK